MTKISTGGTPGSGAGARWRESAIDWTGRPATTKRPGSTGTSIEEAYAYYPAGQGGNSGQLQSIDSLNNSILGTRLFSYDSQGDLLRTVVDINGNNAIDLNTDRIVESETAVEDVGGELWEVSKSWSYRTTGSPTRRQMFETGRRVDGDPLVQAGYTKEFRNDTASSGTRTDSITVLTRTGAGFVIGPGKPVLFRVDRTGALADDFPEIEKWHFLFGGVPPP